MAKRALVIVESPTKAKTIRKFLPKSFVVEASMGHVRDLPQSAADIPKSLKEEEWTKIGVNVEKDFEPLYVVPKGKTKVIHELKRKLKDADVLYLATDEDREGESISWHLLEILKPKIPVKRMVFHEITKSAIEKALEDCRELDTNLVRAQEARRILDRLFGYTLSPLIWKKIAFGLSAGRVQSAALRLVIERERERIRFQKASYWDLLARLAKGKEEFGAKLTKVDGVRIASGKDFDETTGKLRDAEKVKLLGEAEAKKLDQALRGATWKVVSLEEKEFAARPAIPFITSTLQQEGNRKLGMTAKDTMRVAQSLYEEGLITYMRTDSPALSQQAIAAARAQVQELFGKEYLSPEPRQFSSKNKGAQEAHEAIRPAGSQFVHPKDTGLSGRELAVYELIWKRTVACQMADARKQSLTAKIEAGDAEFSSTGTRILFPGFLRAYVEGSDDPEAALEDQETLLPELKEGETLKLSGLEALPHETKPPARYTEASLVQTMEKAGIGRPSTYASVIATLVDRDYAVKNGNALTPTFTGFAVIQLLEKHFDYLVDLGFTSKMEESLDEIAEGKIQWLPYMREFFLGKTGLKSQVEEREKKIDPKDSRTLDLGHLKGVQVKIGRYGAYLVEESGKKGEEGAHATIPLDVAPADLSPETARTLIELSAKGPEPIGAHPDTKEPIFVLSGRFGPYVQQGEVTDANPKPRRASVPKGVNPQSVTLDQALVWLSLPRELGPHPASGKPIVANNGRFGPYVQHDGEYRSLKKDDSPYTVTLARALELFAQEKKGRGGSTLLRDLGAHPETGKPVGIYEGKYGAYVKCASTNATLPKDAKVEAFTLDEAVKLLAERKGAKKSRRR